MYICEQLSVYIKKQLLASVTRVKQQMFFIRPRFAAFSPNIRRPTSRHYKEIYCKTVIDRHITQPYKIVSCPFVEVGHRSVEGSHHAGEVNCMLHGIRIDFVTWRDSDCDCRIWNNCHFSLFFESYYNPWRNWKHRLSCFANFFMSVLKNQSPFFDNEIQEK